MASRRAAGILLVSQKGRLLFLRRSDDGTWAIPGGMVEDTDESPAYAALRELWEETGYHGIVDLERATLDATRSPSGLIYWSFGGRVPREFRPSLNHEHTEGGWFYWDEIPEPLHPGVRQLLGKLDIR